MCDPPQDEADVRRIARDIGTKPAGEQTTYPGANGTEPPDAETLRAERLDKMLRGVTGGIAFAEDGSVIPAPIQRYVIESVIPAKKNGGRPVGSPFIKRALPRAGIAPDACTPAPVCRAHRGSGAL